MAVWSLPLGSRRNTTLGKLLQTDVLGKRLAWMLARAQALWGTNTQPLIRAK